MASDQNRQASGSGFGIPSLLFAILATAIVIGAALFVGYTETRPRPVPSAIGANTAATASGTPAVVRFTRSISVVEPSSGGLARLASLAAARLSVNGTIVCSTSGGGTSKAEGRMPILPPGAHTLVIETESAAGECAVLACIDLAPSGERVVTDASWNAASSMARVVGGYESPPIGPVFGPLESESISPKGAGFWIPLVGLIFAMAVACFAGPLLRPTDRSRPDTSIVDLAVVLPSVAYASAGCVITSLSAFGVGPAAIGGLHVFATAVFALALVAWTKGATFIESDQAHHRAELSGYDSMQVHFEMLQASTASRTPAFQTATNRALRDLGEAIRYASTSNATPEIDARVIAALLDLEAKSSLPAEMPAAEFVVLAQEILTLLRRREVFAQASRRG